MKKTKNINEEYLRGIPEFVLRQETSKFVDCIRKHISAYINRNPMPSSADQQRVREIADEQLKKLEEKVNNSLEESLWNFTQNV